MSTSLDIWEARRGTIGVDQGYRVIESYVDFEFDGSVSKRVRPVGTAGYIYTQAEKLSAWRSAGRLS